MNPLATRLSDKKIILGSASPRRKELLKKLEISFQIKVKPIDENFPNSLNKNEIAAYISQKKAEAFDDLQANEILITADTIVCLKNRIITKPRNLDEGKSMLAELSENMHEVYTGFTVKDNNKTETKTVKTNVYFKNLSVEEIDFYVEKYKPLDKAGGYGAQEWLGFVAIEKIEGSYLNVVGLPLKELYETLIEF